MLSKQTTRIAIVEDNDDYRQAMVATIGNCQDMLVVWTAAQRSEAEEYVTALIADVIILDLGLPDGSGLDLIPKIVAAQPQCAIMVNSVFADESRIFSALQAGALGYLLKDGYSNDLLSEIRLLLAGGSPINPMVARKLLQKTQQLPSPKEAAIASGTTMPVEGKPMRLSSRETLALKWFSRGYTTTETAEIMCVSDNTIRTYVRRIYQKLHVSNRTSAIAVARQQGWFEGD